jgi:hypothetical protein
MSPLRRRMIEDRQIRNLTANTQRVYVAQVVRFASHFGAHHKTGARGLPVATSGDGFSPSGRSGRGSGNAVAPVL